MPTVQAPPHTPGFHDTEAYLSRGGGSAIGRTYAMVEQPGGKRVLGAGGSIPEPPLTISGRGAAARLKGKIDKFRQDSKAQSTTGRCIANLAAAGIVAAGGTAGTVFSSLELFGPKDGGKLGESESNSNQKLKEGGLYTSAILSGHLAYAGAKGLLTQIRMLAADPAARLDRLKLDGELRAVLRDIIREAEKIHSGGQQSLNYLKHNTTLAGMLSPSQTAIHSFGSEILTLKNLLEQPDSTVSAIQQSIGNLESAADRFGGSSDVVAWLLQQQGLGFLPALTALLSQPALLLELQAAASEIPATSNGGSLPEVAASQESPGLPPHTAIDAPRPADPNSGLPKQIQDIAKKNQFVNALGTQQVKPMIDWLVRMQANGYLNPNASETEHLNAENSNVPISHTPAHVSIEITNLRHSLPNRTADE